MLIQFRDYLTFDLIYLWTTLGVLPFWLMLIFIPNSKITQIFVNSVILPLILAAAYGCPTALVGMALAITAPVFLSVIATTFILKCFLLVLLFSVSPPYSSMP